ncbi:hypothetical protein [Streptomyces phaeoluteigriseus]|uniref:hypothetical protein n=1 Tax=Streptomyces phaeoluteigriseus TaxID=114686 RepID=UPI000ACC4AA8|nr:hypothetical protein [Streptomyces phaeoluteigriseus]
MGTKTVDEAGAETGAEAAEAQRDEKAVDVTKADAQDEVTPASEDADGVDDSSEDTEEGEVVDVVEGSRPSGVGLGAGAVVSAALGLVSLSGGWIGTVASARQTLVGQLETSSTASVANQIQAVYGDAWQTTALWAGLFALAALVTGVVVLARPAFGTPGRVQAPWIKSVAWAGVTLGVIGLLLAVLKYTDALLGLRPPVESPQFTRGLRTAVSTLRPY